MPRAEPLIGYFTGTYNEAPARISVYKAGRTYRLWYGDRKHLGHPSVKTIEDAKREAFLVFSVKVESYSQV